MSDPFSLNKVVDALKNSQNILFITGAGISSDSGLPTYRGIGGLYNNQTTEEGIPIEEVLSGKMFYENPQLTWKYIYEIERACRGASFNEAHKIISQIENEFKRVWVLTQNIDGFHKQAGSKKVIEIHGNLYDLSCIQCGTQKSVSDYSLFTEIPPACEFCNSIVRPNVVLFGEMLVPEKVMTLEEELAQGFDMVFSIGTTSVFPYISRPVFEAARRGACTVEINPSETEVSPVVAHHLKGTAKKTISEIYSLWKGSGN